MRVADYVVTAGLRRSSFGAGVVGGLALILSGCMTIEEMAPPIGPDFAQLDMGGGVTLSVLEAGRKVYISKCARCHSVEPIARYSRDNWRSIVVRMAPESSLDDASTQALQAYVLAAHQVLERRSARN